MLPWLRARWAGPSIAALFGAVVPWPGDGKWGINFVENWSVQDGVRTNGNISSLMTVTRAANTKRAWNSAGHTVQFNSNVLGITDLGLNLWPSRVNDIWRVPDLSASPWSNNSGEVTVTKDQPNTDGTANSACRVKANQNDARLTQAITNSSQTRMMRVIVQGITVTGKLWASFDGGSTEYDVTPVGDEDEEFLCGPQTAVTDPTIRFRLTADDDEFIIRQVDLHRTSTIPGPPIYTAGALATMNADNTAVTDSSAFATTGTLVVEFEDEAGPIGVDRYIARIFIGSNDYIDLLIATDNKIHARCRRTSGTAATVCDLSSSGTVVRGGRYKVAFRFGTDDFAVAFSTNVHSGTTPQLDTSGSLPSGTIAFVIGHNGSGAAQLSGFIRSIFYSSTKLNDDALNAAAGAVPVPPIVFEDGDTYTPWDALDWPETINGCPAPQGAVYSEAQGKWLLSSGLTTQDLVAQDIWAPTLTAYYADVEDGDESNDGLSEETPKKYISSIVKLGNADLQTASRFYVKGGRYTQIASINGTDATEPTKNCAFVGYGGDVLHIAVDETAFPVAKDGTYTNSYVWTFGVAPLRVFDLATLDADGEPTEIPLKANQSAADSATGGGIYINGNELTLRRADGAAPTTSNTIVVCAIDVALFETWDKHAYFEGIKFFGGHEGACRLEANDAVRNIVWKDCTGSLAGSPLLTTRGDGLVVVGTIGLIFRDGCRTSKNAKDGANTHHGDPDEPTYDWTMNHVGYANGIDPLVSTNLYTTHEGVLGVGLNIRGGKSVNGADLATIDDTITDYYACDIVSTSLNGAAAAVFTSATVRARFCTLTSSTYTLRAGGSGATIYEGQNRYVAGVWAQTSGGQILGGGLMITASDAFAIIRARLVANKPAGLSAFRFQNEDRDTNEAADLPDTPVAFAYVEFLTERAGLAGFGGGRGSNLYRNPARIVAYVFVPRGDGLAVATDLAEAIAVLFRSYRDSSISCFEASVYPGGDGAQLKPPGLTSPVDNYFYAVAEIGLFFDLVG